MVRGWIDGCALLFSGNVRSVSAGGMRDSALFAGVTGIRGEEFTFINTNLAAAEFGYVYVRSSQDDNHQVSFGTAADTIEWAFQSRHSFPSRLAIDCGAKSVPKPTPPGALTSRVSS